MTARFDVGDRLILRPLHLRGSGDQEVVVYKVARKWGYAKPEGSRYPDVKFDLETGFEDGRGYASTHRVLSPQQDAEESRQAKATAELRGHGVLFEPWAQGRYSASVLEQMCALLRNERPRPASSRST